MGEVISLSAYRKERERRMKGSGAAVNRAKHGLSKAERGQEREARNRLDKMLDQSKLTTDAPAGEPQEPAPRKG